MRKKPLFLLLAGATLLASAPAAWTQANYGKAKQAYAEEPLTATEADEVAASFERALRCEIPVFDDECKAEACKDGCTEECKAATAKYREKVAANPVAYYAEAFSRRPASWKVLAPLVGERFVADRTTAGERAIMLELLAWAPYETAAKLSSHLFAQRADAFTQEHVLAFATRGGKPFEERLREQAIACNAQESPCDIRPAAYFALHESAVGKDALVRVVKHASFEEGPATQPLIAALALERLGQGGVFQAMLGRVQEAAFAALDAGDLERARELGLSAQYFQELAGAEKNGKWVDLAWLDEKLAGRCAAEAPRLADAHALFLLIESVSPM